MHQLPHGALQESAPGLGLRARVGRIRYCLCRRAIEPRLGYWTVPAGFMENGETMQQARGARMSGRGACRRGKWAHCSRSVNVTRAHQVHVMFRAKLLEPKFAPGPESLEVALYEEANIPWSELAFASGEYTLRQYFADRSAGREEHPFHGTEGPIHGRERTGLAAVAEYDFSIND